MNHESDADARKAQKPMDLATGMKYLAHWAAMQPDPVRAGTRVGFMYALAARVKERGSEQQKQRVTDMLLQFADDKSPLRAESFEELNASILDFMGWEE